ncbi:hypothetical protein [Streptomyces gilvus]|uniref:hypothetical protein n=1 Tax=Streptomyces gilvus TaxID=2920937 RepID=UPI001F111094|nr:hypothetical protein [Streptomyces sp. CME 23]MCH5676903.1 hypothetical protein [Streptomyces sp. CME 23]
MDTIEYKDEGDALVVETRVPKTEVATPRQDPDAHQAYETALQGAAFTHMAERLTHRGDVSADEATAALAVLMKWLDSLQGDHGVDLAGVDHEGRHVVAQMKLTLQPGSGKTATILRLLSSLPQDRRLVLAFAEGGLTVADVKKTQEAAPAQKRSKTERREQLVSRIREANSETLERLADL